MKHIGGAIIFPPKEQADDLILWIGNNQPNNATGASARELSLDAWIGAALPKNPGSASGFRWLVANMEPTNVPKFFIHAFEHGSVRLQLTLAGWERYTALKQARIESRAAFMAMKFGDAELDDVVNRRFRPAVRRTGFELRVLTDNQQAGLIDDQIRSALLSARFVVADLTHGSFGAIGKPALPMVADCQSSIPAGERNGRQLRRTSIPITWQLFFGMLPT